MYSKFKTRLTERSSTTIIIIILFFAVIFSVAPLTLRKKRVSQKTDLNVTPLQRHHAPCNMAKSKRLCNSWLWWKVALSKVMFWMHQSTTSVLKDYDSNVASRDRSSMVNNSVGGPEFSRKCKRGRDEFLWSIISVSEKR